MSDPLPAAVATAGAFDRPVAGAAARVTPAAAAYVVTALFAAAFSYQLYRMPIQVSDSLGEIVNAQHAPSLAVAFTSSLDNAAYLRPLRIAQIKAVFDASGGHYRLAYRGVHVFLFVATLFLFVRALRVRTGTDVAAAVFALTVFTGLHTFRGTVHSAYPINHFLEMVLFALLALNLTLARPSRLTDAAAAATFAAAALTLESGLLVWVVIVAAWVVGFRGVSWRGVVAVTALAAAYVWVRFAYLDTGVPALEERSSGFGFAMLEPDELQARFGANPLPFYLYNVGTSILSVLFTEPRHGVWEAARAWQQSEVPPRLAVGVISSLLTTTLIAATAVRARKGDDDTRLLVVFAAVLVANAVLSYAYTKDEIISIAGAFYAIAGYVTVRQMLRVACTSRGVAAALVTLMVFIASAGWAIRSGGLHYSLVTMAFKQRNDWVAVPPQDYNDAQALALIETLRRDAIGGPRVDRRVLPSWSEAWLDE